MENYKSIYENSYDYINEFIKYYQIPSVERVEDVVNNYTDFYISKKKDEDGNEIDHYFKFFGIMKKKNDEKRPKTISVFYFGKKKETELSRDYPELDLKRFEVRFALFCHHFQIVKKFYEIEEIEKKINEIQ